MALYYAPAIGSYLLARCLYLGPIEGYFLFCTFNVVAQLWLPVVGYLFVWRSLLSRRSSFFFYPSFHHSPPSLPYLTQSPEFSPFLEDYLKTRLRIFGVHPTWSSNGRHGHLLDFLSSFQPFSRCWDFYLLS